LARPIRKDDEGSGRKKSFKGMEKSAQKVFDRADIVRDVR
jgi:hypothetical protein